MIRQPVVAGQFYPGSAQALRKEVAAYLSLAAAPSEERVILAMAPHAGYVYSGAVAGKTLGAAKLASTVLLLGPNHTGRGARLAVWPDGAWAVPGCEMPVDAELAAALLEAEPRLRADRDAHLGEHSLEVMLPFLCVLGTVKAVVPLCVAERDPAVLAGVGANMAAVLAKRPEPVSLVVSSDMSHYVSQAQAKRLDALALDRVMALDPAGLYATVRDFGISMCGALPMTLALHVALGLGATKASITAYATSGEASGDYERVVGYAGALVS